MKRTNKATALDSLLREDGIYEEVTSVAIQRVPARQLEAAMQKRRLSRTERAKRMRRSRAELNRLLDPANGSVTLGTLQEAATVVGRETRVELV
jgi:hypothetical protein